MHRVRSIPHAAAILGVSSGSLDAQRLLQGLNRGFWANGTTQELSNTLWGVAELGQTLQREQLQEVLDALLADREQVARWPANDAPILSHLRDVHSLGWNP